MCSRLSYRNARLVTGSAWPLQDDRRKRNLNGTGETIRLGTGELGRLLVELKEEIGHRKWLIWLPANFPALGKTNSARVDNAARCMRFYRENQIPGNSGNLSPPKNFSVESVRKFMWGYIPAKELPELEGNRKLKAGAHYLSFVNHFAKFDRQARVGLIPMPPIDLFRRECEQTVRRIIEIGGKEWARSLLD
jgi:hypothetical protein